MFEAYCKLKTKSKTIAEVKEALRVIWGNLPQELIDETLNIKLYTLCSEKTPTHVFCYVSVENA